MQAGATLQHRALGHVRVTDTRKSSHSSSPQKCVAHLCDAMTLGEQKRTEPPRSLAQSSEGWGQRPVGSPEPECWALKQRWGSWAAAVKRVTKTPH